MSGVSGDGGSPPAWRAWTWVPSLYFVQGLPYVIVNNTSVALFASMGVGNAEMAFLTSWLSLVWAAKALWSPFVDGVSTKRRWTVATQLAIAPVLVGVAAALPLPSAVWLVMAGFVLVALLSATHDIAADGLYMLGLSTPQQGGFVGVRSTFWRLALVSAEGGMVVAAGVLGGVVGRVAGWQLTFLAAAAFFAAAAAFHAWALPRPVGDAPRPAGGALQEGVAAWRSFVAKPDLVPALAFIVFYRFAENHLSKLIVPFFLAAPADGGLGLSLEQVGFVKGTVGVLCLVAGGLAGGASLAAFGLRRSLPAMVVALNAPDVVYVALAATRVADLPVVAALVGLESFGYGFGFAAYMMFLMRLADGPYRTSHYAFGTGLMALSVWLAQFWSGYAQSQLGYVGFFVWVCVLTLPGAAVSAWVLRTELVPRDEG